MASSFLFPDPTSSCTICDSPNAQACAGCHSTRYCSPECQQTDWPSHGLLCSKYTTHIDRPDPSYKRAIFFPPKENKPEFIWIECRTDKKIWVPGDTQECQVREHLDGGFPHRKLIQRNHLRSRNLTNSFQVICRETCLLDGSELNKSVIKATNGAAGSSWKGPIVAMKKIGRGAYPREYMDIDMTCYRDVVDYFISYRDGSAPRGKMKRIMWGKVRGVKINCKGDQSTSGAEVYSAVDVPRQHPVFLGPIVPISRLVGMPIHTRRYPPNRLWKDDHDHVDSPYENVPATCIHMISDRNKDWWGLAPIKWQYDVGSVLVVRSDNQDVTTQQVEALCHFCQFKMQPLFENALGGGLVEMTRAEVMRYITPGAFRDYVAEMRAGKVEEGEEEE